jgi:sphinganine-1-phosphate aldolase
VAAAVLPELSAALVAAADAVRGVPRVDGDALLGSLAETLPGGAGVLAGASAGLDSDTAAGLLGAFGLLGSPAAAGALPDRLAPVLALVEALPAALTERLLIELLARVVEPHD